VKLLLKPVAGNLEIAITQLVKRFNREGLTHELQDREAVHGDAHAK
jgi:hypothetical protein